MTRVEYADYERRFRSGSRWVHSFTPIEGSEHFSWRSCEMCDRPNMGGNRTDCTWLATPDAEHLEVWRPSNQPMAVCDDCIYYQEYGQLDDATMLDLENEE